MTDFSGLEAMLAELKQERSDWHFELRGMADNWYVSIKPTAMGSSGTFSAHAPTPTEAVRRAIAVADERTKAA